MVIFSALVVASASAQQFKSCEAGFEQYKDLLQAAGYEAFCFDLTGLHGGRYYITMSIKEYKEGKEVRSEDIFRVKNKTMVSDFREEQQAKIIASGLMADPATQTYTRAEKLTIGFYPSGTDTLTNIMLDVSSMGSSTRQLKLDGVFDPSTGKMLYSYLARPVVVGTFETGKFIPLVLYGSMWYDEQSNICRFCGEREIASDLSGDITKQCPHFFVIGVEFTKQ